MSLSHDTTVAIEPSATLPGRATIARIRRVLIVAVIAAFVYPVFMTASASACAGGIDADGGFIDSADRSVDSAPLCVGLTLAPNPLIYVAIAAIVLWAITRVLRAERDEVALRILDRAAIAVGLLVPVAIVVSRVWFFLIPLESLTSGSFTVFSPFPFGSIEVSTTTMTSP